MTFIATAVLGAFYLFGANEAHPDVSGIWRIDPSSSKIHSRILGDTVWIIEQKDEAIHFTESGAGKGTVEVRCGIRGADCATKEAGKPLTVSFFYNGPALVEMETEGKGEAVTKRKMQLSNDGSELIVEVTHIVPEGRGPEKYVLKKQQ